MIDIILTISIIKINVNDINTPFLKDGLPRRIKRQNPIARNKYARNKKFTLNL